MSTESSSPQPPPQAKSEGVEPSKPEVQRSSPNRLLYIAAGAVVLVVFIVTAGQGFLGLSEVVYRRETLTVLYAVLSLAAALMTFGVIGDSGALLKLSRKTGTSVQVSGSAAGFMVFYYLLSSGLNPYTHLDVFLYKENGELMRANDGEFEVTVASRISQVKETDTGQAAASWFCSCS